ncbi:hypothetical protein VTJ83DRAFT_4268 [Remersonia thermophila]|uniref:Cns1/TTC4 wheel domain-containing protein n=1 Tax=Remersonia thermophila TaxID=72144 RepID=A0ABR4DAZ3_9PEZI
MPDVDKVAQQAEGLSLGDGEAMPMFPELPPGRTLNAGLTLEETVADLSKHPLFMTELDPNEDNEALAALQAIAYEGTPLENAQNFKEQGNESFREKRWPDAKEFYGKGIAILAAEEQRRAKGLPRKVRKTEDTIALNKDADMSAKPEDLVEDDKDKAAQANDNDFTQEPDDPAEVQREKALLETLHVNRAACHLELRNYRSCTLDCAAALRLNPRNIKAYYRSAKALLAVERAREAEDACTRGLALDPSNKPLLALQADIAKASAAAAARQKVEEERASRERRRKALLKAALAARNIRTRSTGRPPDMEDARVKLSPDELDPASALVVPTLLLYPCHAESDFIKAFSERECLEQHFGYVFPLPWDRAGEYSGSGAVECFAETVSGGLVKVGKKVPLLKVLSGGNVEIVDDLLKIFVVPKGRADGFIKGWKENKGKQ